MSLPPQKGSDAFLYFKCHCGRSNAVFIYLQIQRKGNTENGCGLMGISRQILGKSGNLCLRVTGKDQAPFPTRDQESRWLPTRPRLPQRPHRPTPRPSPQLPENTPGWANPLSPSPQALARRDPAPGVRGQHPGGRRAPRPSEGRPGAELPGWAGSGQPHPPSPQARPGPARP